MNGYEIGIIVGVIAYIVFDLVGDWTQHKRLIAIEAQIAELMRMRKAYGLGAPENPAV